MGPSQSLRAVLPPVVRHVYVTVVSFSSQELEAAGRRHGEETVVNAEGPLPFHPPTQVGR
ncbi:hypothetical protein GCM10009544_17740 [Streptomyces stramineus]|uniref:Uncharacterized protein n=1 Tax=Streptomyces stramineus TaxID=173861 RepID=A0ABN0ZQA4_9ACTN